MANIDLVKDERIEIHIHDCSLGDLYGFRKLLKGEMNSHALDDGRRFKSLHCKFGKIEMVLFADLPEPSKKEVQQ